MDFNILSAVQPPQATLERSYCLQKKPLTLIRIPSSAFPPSPAQPPTHCVCGSACSCHIPSRRPHTAGGLWVWLLSPSARRPARCLGVSAWQRAPGLLSFVGIMSNRLWDRPHFIHPSAGDGHLSSFQSSAVVNSLCTHVCVRLHFHFSRVRTQE